MQAQEQRQAALDAIAKDLDPVLYQYQAGLVTLAGLAQFFHDNPLPNLNGLIDPATSLRYLE